MCACVLVCDYNAGKNILLIFNFNCSRLFGTLFYLFICTGAEAEAGAEFCIIMYWPACQHGNIFEMEINILLFICQIPSRRVCFARIAAI